jgi:hypothetical protein
MTVGRPFERGKGGAPIGNTNAKKAKRWEDALWKALKQYATDTVKAGEALDRIAFKVVECALDGDKDAWAEIGNRLDGKPHLSLEVSQQSVNYIVEVPALAASSNEWLNSLKPTSSGVPALPHKLDS